jgi:radical SAM superfamily enzyme YgiQ (UPF0313 family)
MTKQNGVQKVLLVDVPTYKVQLPELHRSLLKRRLETQSALIWQRLRVELIRPGLTYSRGLLILASVLEAHGFDVRYLIYVDPLDAAQMLPLASEADVVCFSAMTPTVDLVKDLCTQVKELTPAVVTVVGGPHVTARPVQTLEQGPAIDFGMIGECEHRLPQLLRSIDHPERVAGVVLRESDGKVHLSSQNVEPVIISEVPLPAYHLLNRSLEQYAHNIRTSRGCSYGCEFCYDSRTWNSFSESTRRPSQVLDELKLLARTLKPHTLVHFSDAIFNLDWENYTQGLVERIKRAELSLRFSFDTRVDHMDEEQARKLVAAGFLYFRMGFESTQENQLSISKKAITQADQLEASRIVRRVSNQAVIHAYMVTGLPGSNRKSISLDAERIHSLVVGEVVDVVGNKVLVPYPGTDYHEQAEDFGVDIITTDWAKYDRRSYPVYRLENLSADEIYFGYLFQEAALANAYEQRLNGETGQKHESHDYLYLNYVGKRDV